jgi:hypothetical protein
MEGTTALVAIDQNRGFSRRSLLLLALLLVSAPIARSQDQSANTPRDAGYWILSTTEGVSLVTGSTSQTTTTEAAVGIGFAHHGSGRWSYPFDFIGSFNGAPDSVAQQINTSGAQINFATFMVDPTFDIAQGRRWGL